MLKCLIIEDEEAAQEILQIYIDKTPFLKLIGVFESGLQATSALINDADVLFLDIQIPELNGLSFLRTLENPPKVIVTTAFSDYAIEAFEEAVVDYLVKPFSYERFFKAVVRVREHLVLKKGEEDRFVYLYADKTIYKVNLDQILYLKGEVDYVRFVLSDKEILVLDSLKNFRERLMKSGFLQIHRSYVVNLNKMEKVSASHFTVANHDLPIGKTYREDLMKNIDLS